MRPTIHAIGTAVPKNCIDQSTVCEFMTMAHGLNQEESRKLKVLYRATGISTRFSVISDYSSTNPEDWNFYAQNKGMKPFPTTSQRGELYRSNAIHLSRQAIGKCLKSSRIGTHEITHLITVSCTGMYAPGLDFDIINQMGLQKNIQRTSINFMGCFAALTAMKAANSICNSDPKSIVLVVCVELCTIHFQNENTEDNLLANSIFGDGAAAFVMSSRKSKEFPGLSPEKFHSNIIPEGRGEMAWNIGDFGYEMKLSSYVPDLIKNGIGMLVSDLTKELDSQPDLFAIHPGGKKILEVIESELGISKSRNQHAYSVLRKFGNMSSPTLLFVLQCILESISEADAGKHVLGLAFGPGLTLESTLLKVV